MSEFLFLKTQESLSTVVPVMRHSSVLGKYLILEEKRGKEHQQLSCG